MLLPTVSGPNVQGLAEVQYARCIVWEGGFPALSRKRGFYSESTKDASLDPLPTFLPSYESTDSYPELAKKYFLERISPAARNFLSSSFVNVESPRNTEGEPHPDIHPIGRMAGLSICGKKHASGGKNAKSPAGA